MALDLKEQTYTSAGMPNISANGVCMPVVRAAVYADSTPANAGCP